MAQNPDYRYHFNNPDPTGMGETEAGGDYYYNYGPGLFIVLNTNNYNVAEHEEAIRQAVEAYPKANWRVVTIHQDIYGSGLDHSDTDGMILRTQLTPVFDRYDIDVVLQGHDHTYSRSKLLYGDSAAHGSYVTDPQGTLYMSANSASGSKYYELISQQQDYIAARSQNWLPSYSVIDIDHRDFKITTYQITDEGNVEMIDSTFTIHKTADR